MLARTDWQVYESPNQAPNPVAAAQQHGHVGSYAAAPAIPPAMDPSWRPCGTASPQRAGAPICPDGSTIQMSVASRLSGCWSNLDFTFFQSLVAIPVENAPRDFKIVMNGADDGARVSIFNSKHPQGFVFDGSYIYLGGSQSTTDLSAYVVPGEVNRVIVTQVDDCAVQNNLNSAQIVLNGAAVPQEGDAGR